MKNNKKHQPSVGVKTEESSNLVELNKKLEDQLEITKKAQLDYINLKSDFDFLLRQTKAKEATFETDTTIKIVKKLIPFVEDLRKSLLHLSGEQKSDGIGKGVQIVYDKFLASLSELGITPIDEIGIEPNTVRHEPVSMLPTNDESMKGKIIQIFDQGFIFSKDGIETVITPAKVIIGQ